MAHRFMIVDEIIRQYRLLNTVGTQLTVRLLPPSDEDETGPISHFLDSVTDLCEQALRNCNDSDVVRVSIRIEVNVKDMAIGICFRQKNQVSADVISSVWEKVTQSNSCFNALDTLVLEVTVKMPVRFGDIKIKGRLLAILAHLKKSIVRVKSETNCLAH